MGRDRKARLVNRNPLAWVTKTSTSRNLTLVFEQGRALTCCFHMYFIVEDFRRFTIVIVFTFPVLEFIHTNQTLDP